jgi:pimeloyl-ACP methyl ester carboxylesterase
VLARVDGSARRIVRAAQRLGMVRLLSAPLFRHPFRAPGWAIRALADDLRPHSFTLAADSLVGYDMAAWRAVTVPVSVLIGDHDIFIATADGQELRRVMPQVTLAVIDDCGHFPHVEHPRAVLAALA